MTALGVSAQDGSRSRWTVTPRVGTNVSTFNGLKRYATDEDGSVVVAGDMDAKRKWGVTLGADVEWRMKERIGFSGGWFFSDQGYEHFHQYCFNMPLLVHFYAAPGLTLKTGVQVDGLVSARQTVGGKRLNVLNSLKTVGLVLPVGVSYDYRLYTVDVRYCLGLTDWCDVHQYNRLGTSWKTYSLWLTLGYRFNL